MVIVNWPDAMANIIGSIVGGLLVAILLAIFYVLNNPKLNLVFKERVAFALHRVSRSPKAPYRLYIRLNIYNTRNTIAHGCKVLLLRLEQKAGKRLVKIYPPVHQTLKWSFEQESEGYQGLEMPGRTRRQVDVVYAPKGSDKFFLAVPRGREQKGFPNGVYRFTVQAFGANAGTVTKQFILDWMGPFEPENIRMYKSRWFHGPKDYVTDLFSKFTLMGPR